MTTYFELFFSFRGRIHRLEYFAAGLLSKIIALGAQLASLDPGPLTGS